MKGMFLASTKKKAREVLKTMLFEFFDDESDIDLLVLVLTKSEYSRTKRHEITDLFLKLT